MLVMALLALVAMTITTDALAFGSFRLKSTAIAEVDGRWKFDVDADYGSKPHIGHIPFDFVFVQTTYYEYSITDTDKEPVQRRKPMHNQDPQREQMDIGFADARGDTWQRTKFSFSLRRDRGFSAGEYTLTVKRTSDGATMGSPLHITLNGQNELIDRRAIVFTGEKKKKDKPKDGAAGDKPEGEKAEPAAATTDEPTEDGDKAADEPDDSDLDKPPAVEKRPGGHGCGCRAAGPASGGAAGLASMILGVAMIALRRRRSRA
jgi:hypothetical protein